jgi:hypothetical protein
MARRARVPNDEREAIDAALRHVDFLAVEINTLDRAIAIDASDSPDVRRLMSVPGVSVITATGTLLVRAGGGLTGALVQLAALAARRRRRQARHVPLVHERGHGHRPAAADLADDPVVADLGAGEEHLVEPVRAVHLVLRADLDAGLVQSMMK